MFEKMRVKRYTKKAMELYNRHSNAKNLGEKVFIGFEINEFKSKVTDAVFSGKISLKNSMAIYKILSGENKEG